jgi:hypothetical protein
MFQQRQDNVPESIDDFIAGQTGAYVEYSNEKVYIIAGPEYVGLEGCLFIIYKALYGLLAGMKDSPLP